jgi:hypothetical protein
VDIVSTVIDARPEVSLTLSKRKLFSKVTGTFAKLDLMKPSITWLRGSQKFRTR